MATATPLDFHWVQNLYDRNPVLAAFRKRGDGFALLVSFLHDAFETRRQSRYVQPDLINRLADFLLATSPPSDVPDETAKRLRDYLDEWTNDGMLRRFYDDLLHEEPFYELTPEAALLIRWLQELDKNEFVGTESRLRVLFDLLEQLAFQTSTDKASRIEQLRREMAEKQAEIDRIESGDLAVWDSSRIRDHFQLVQETARRLLADFRQVEQNFRHIDTELRDEILTTSLSKGKLLDNLFATIDQRIWARDQGKSFRAFWELLMDQQKQDELDQLLAAVTRLDDVRDDTASRRALEHLKFDLVEAGGTVNRATDAIIRSLRRLIESSFFREHKHVLQKIEAVLELAIQIKPNLPKPREPIMQIDGRPMLDFFLSRPLFKPAHTAIIRSAMVEAGQEDTDITDLLLDDDISLEQLEANVNQLLRGRSQVSLTTVLAQFPPEKGLAELIGYVALATQAETRDKAVVGDEPDDEITFSTATGERRTLHMPTIIFVK